MNIYKLRNLCVARLSNLGDPHEDNKVVIVEISDLIRQVLL